MTVPFTYIITHISSGVKYYGVKYARNCHPRDLGITYFSSSRIVTNMIAEEGIDKFKFEVRKRFKTKKAAVSWETKFLNKVSAATSDKWFNLYNGGDVWYNRGGYTLSDETRQKMRKPKSNEHQKKLAKILNAVREIPDWTDERKVKHSERMLGQNNPMYGKKASSDTRKKMRDAHIGKKLSIIECAHCSRSMSVNAHTRWHGPKCKIL
ncbi:MAG: hypothetical protein COA84_13385 [Robiginitomaculum sp.]|nr:MAG: hypothetical protein COA84_13385 [Robiginitomaculum sp.]